MSDPQTKLGQLIEGEQLRDAVHIAVAPVKAATLMAPGTHVGLDAAGDASPLEALIGIVDPFLMLPVKKGQTFWLFLYPNTITSLKHVWTHSAFKDEQPDADKVVVIKSKKESEQWLRDFIERSDCPSYERIIEAVTHGSPREDYYRIMISDNSFFVGGTDASGEIPPEFWDHIEIVTGVKQKHRPEYFSCSC